MPRGAISLRRIGYLRGIGFGVLDKVTHCFNRYREIDNEDISGREQISDGRKILDPITFEIVFQTRQDSIGLMRGDQERVATGRTSSSRIITNPVSPARMVVNIGSDTTLGDRIISRIEVDDQNVRIIGDNATLGYVIAGFQTQAGNVRGFVRKWRTRHDSNV